MPGRARTEPRRRTPSPAAIDHQRQLQMATISRARALGEDDNALLDKAASLLTAHWGGASWEGRAAILKTVDWLLQVALNNPQPAARAHGRPLTMGTSGPRREPPRHH